MEPEDLVPSLELCKEAKELGIEIDSYFVWRRLKGFERWEIGIGMDQDPSYEVTPAPLAEETWQLLPQYINVNDVTYYLEQSMGLAYGVTRISYRSLDEEAIIEYTSESVSTITQQTLIWLSKREINFT